MQFHSYGAEEPKTGLFGSEVEPLADYLNAHPGLSVDVGQVMFGETTAMTADGAVGHFLRGWAVGSGSISMSNKRRVAASCRLPIAIRIWFMPCNGRSVWSGSCGSMTPGTVALSTDHPNGGSFLSYPKLIALLMDRGLRSDVLKTLPAGVQTRSKLADLTREYSLWEIAVITRGTGADAGSSRQGPSHRARRGFDNLRAG